MILYMYIVPGQVSPRGQSFDVNRNVLPLHSFVAIFFIILHMNIAPGQVRGRQPSGDKVLMSTEMSCHFIHLLQVSKNVLEV